MKKVVVDEVVVRADTINVSIKDITVPIDTYSYTVGLEFERGNFKYTRVENMPFRKTNLALQHLRDPE